MTKAYHKLIRKVSRSIDPYAPCKRKDCKYRAKEGVPWGCNYSDITGRSRINQHPANRNSPAHCKLYEPGERISLIRE